MVNRGVIVGHWGVFCEWSKGDTGSLRVGVER